MAADKDRRLDFKIAPIDLGLFVDKRAARTHGESPNLVEKPIKPAEAHEAIGGDI